MERKVYEIDKDKQDWLHQRMTAHNIQFSGCQVLQTSNPFSYIRRVYGDIKVCIVKEWSTTLLCDKISGEYNSILLRPLVNPNPNRVRTLIPNTCFINGTVPDWEKAVVSYIKQDKKMTLIIMGGIIWYEECKLHYERIFRIVGMLDRDIKG
jgi:hypothetical protein